MNLKPLGNRILVELFNVEDISEGGIFIPETAQEKPQQGIILACGDGKFNDAGIVPMYTKIGDKVLLPKYGGAEVKIDGKKLYIFKEEDVLAIITE